jgi:ADP-heptose:LPS heptosyltransferase
VWFWCVFKRRVDFSSVFFYLSVSYDSKLIHYDTLKDLKQSIRSGLVVSLIQAEWQIIKNTYFDLRKKRQLLNSTNAMTSHAYEQFVQ